VLINNALLLILKKLEEKWEEKTRRQNKLEGPPEA
jgi:hypothetical protein